MLPSRSLLVGLRFANPTYRKQEFVFQDETTAVFLWIPAFAGMTGVKCRNDGGKGGNNEEKCRRDEGEGEYDEGKCRCDEGKVWR